MDYKEKIINILTNKELTSEQEKQLKKIFPELVENEDERIRKEIIQYIKTGTYRKEWIAWLEKQKSVEEIVERCKNSWYNEGKIQGQIEGLIDEEKYQQGWHDALEKQSEQKPNPYSGTSFEYNGHTWGMCARDGGVEILMDRELKAFVSLDESFIYPIHPKSDLKEEIGNNNKVEPKFKVGDWITFYGGKPLKILKVEPEQNGILDYLLLCQDGHDSYYNKKYVDENARLWTIQDAKDGDVLVDKDNNIGIFTRCEGIYWQSYIYLGCNGYLLGDSIGGSHEQTDTHPATKEQCDALMKAITEAVYTFDFEKKELKKIEPPPAWSEEDEKKRKGLIKGLEDRTGFGWASDPFSREEYIDWLKSLKDRLK